MESTTKTKVENDEKKIKLNDSEKTAKENNAGVNSEYYNYYYSQYSQMSSGGYWGGAQANGQAAGYPAPNTQAYYDYYNAYYSQSAQKGYPYPYPTTSSQTPASVSKGTQDYNQWYMQQNGYNYSSAAQPNAYQYPTYSLPAQPGQTWATQSTPSTSTASAKKSVPSNPPIPNLPPPPPPSSKLSNKVSSIASSTTPSTTSVIAPSMHELPTSFQKPSNQQKGFATNNYSKVGVKRPLYTAADTSKPIFGRSLDTNNNITKTNSLSKNSLSSDSLISKKTSDGTVFQKEADNSSTFTVGENASKKFPVSLKLYIENVYKKFPELESNNMAHRILADEISKASLSGSLWTTNWKSYPIPISILQLTNTFSKTKTAPVKNKTGKKDTAPKSSGTDSEKDSEFKRPVNLGPNELKRLEDRKLRFSTNPLPVNTIQKFKPLPISNRNDVIDWDKDTVVGTCTIPEKRFFRLTSAPDPSKVRPLHILKDWTEKLLKKWIDTKDYGYVLDQFQAVRQDLTVQRIKNPFTVYVYESVGRLCLEKGDLGEFNKCQTQLIELYKYKIPGRSNEFIAYRILYYLHTRNQSDINLTLTVLTPEQKEDKAIKHALQLREAMSSANYIKFFQLYKETPNLGRFLIDKFLERERVRFLNIICSVFRQTIPVSYIQTSLGFDDHSACMEFLKDLNINIKSSSSSNMDDNDNLKIETRSECAKVQAKYSTLNRVDLKGQLN